MKKKKILVIILLVIVVVSSNVIFSFAASKTELEQQQGSIDSQIKDTQQDLEHTQSQLSDTMKQIEKLNADISTYQNQIDDLNGQIDSLNSQIDETNKKLADAEAKYEKQQEILQNRLVAMYEAGDTTYLDVLVNSSDIADFISNYYLISEVTSYDTDLLDEMDQNKKEIQQDKDTLEASKTQVEAAKASKVATQKSLQSSQDVKQKYASELTASEQVEQAKLDQFEKDKRDIQNQLAAIAKQEASKNGTEYIIGNPSSHGYIFPVAGCDMSDITNKTYPSYPGHTGVDVNSGRVIGKNIVAVKDGTVVISTAYKDENGYYSYGECIVIDHHDGTMTLYAHGSAGTRRVQVGDQVKQGQVIMTVGSTGNSTGPHLHFEVRVDGKPVNPIPYLE